MSRSALASLRALGPSASLRDCLTQHRAAIAATTEGPHSSTGDGPGFEQLTQLMDEWSEAAAGTFPTALNEYAALFEDALAAARAPPASGGHPRLMILGLLEARLLSFDRVLLAGLDETVWPPAVETDAFLNRPMRAALGLSAPERRIGQTAHDFVGALGAREAILSRAKKRGGQPTVASRFLQRMAAAAGPVAMKEPEERGELYLTFARALDRPTDFQPQRRPAPRPAVELRPKALSVTRIETLRRDPYAIYAEYILRLKALEAVEREIGPRETGMAWHATLQQFVEAYPSGALPPEARDRLLSMARACFALLSDDPAFALHWPNIEKGLDFFLAFERDTRDLVAQAWVERQGALAVPLASGTPFKLSARADRIDFLQSGGARLIDYKSGAPPIAKDVKAGFSPQLTLEAAMLQRGGFEGLPPLETAQAIYLKLGGATGGEEKHAGGRSEKILELAEQHFAGLKMLLEAFACEDTPYLSRPFPKFAPRFSDYDHLARVKEWSATARRERFGGYAMSRALAIPESLRQRQARASNPRTSAWVSANAGSGKTHVLTQRVLRLLLDGTPPAQILCLAYTKAAAANMADRVFSKLALWTSLSDGALAKAIVESGADAPGPRELIFARQLFARTIESPGGLKIQTLHAFAERLLRLFPFEANVPAHFKVLDESDSKRLLLEARDAALVELGASSECAGALDLVARESGPTLFDALLTEALSRAEIFGAHEDAPGYADALRAPLGLAPGVTVASVEAEMLGGDVGRMRRERWAQALDAGTKQDRALAESLRAANEDGASQVRVQALLDAFFKDDGEGEPRGGREGPSDDQELVRKVSLRSRTICVASRIACSRCASAGALR